MIAALLLLLLLIFFATFTQRVLTRLRAEPETLEKKINTLLPQTQCGLCGYNGCRPYARAIANGDADINRCPPGGDVGIEKLARLLRINSRDLDPSRGVSKAPMIAVIDEALCIGCTLCIQACPVDAILGAAKQMHSVLRRDCTGCELCIPPCPVDCIEMRAVATGIH